MVERKVVRDGTVEIRVSGEIFILSLLCQCFLDKTLW